MNDQTLRDTLMLMLRGNVAHMTFEDAVASFPPAHYNTRPPNVPYTPWALLEHIRITQWDILEFVRNPKHVSPSWPEGHWPAPDEQADPARWAQTVGQIQEDYRAIQALAQGPALDLTAPLPHAPGYTLLREILLVIDHNAYHLGEFAILRQVMGTWPAEDAAEHPAE